MSTQLQLALKGIITPELMKAASYDGVSPEWLRNQVASGRCVIPKNKNHPIEPRAIGEGLPVKINANIGTSRKHCYLDEELQKIDMAIKYGADSIMDLSTGGDLHAILAEVIKKSPVMVGTVPIYSLIARKKCEDTPSYLFDPKEILEEIEMHAAMGVDFMTLHCAITRSCMQVVDTHRRITGIVSRGGSFLYKYMKITGKENPLYEYFDDILQICEKYDVTISLGDGLRPGSVADANDAIQIKELLVQGELVRSARAKGVQVMVEGPGHMPLNKIAMNMQLMKKICDGAPLYVLGPLTTDSAAGYDHIAGAIGGAIAAANGANFLCYVTPAEHLCLPDFEDVKQGVIASRIAAHSADVANGIQQALYRDQKLSQARFNLDWNSMFEYMIEPELARKRKQESESNTDDYCSMCGELCSMKTFRSANSL